MSMIDKQASEILVPLQSAMEVGMVVYALNEVADKLIAKAIAGKQPQLEEAHRQYIELAKRIEKSMPSKPIAIELTSSEFACVIRALAAEEDDACQHNCPEEAHSIQALKKKLSLANKHNYLNDRQTSS